MHRRSHSLIAAVTLLFLCSSVAYADYDEKDSPPDLFCEPGRTSGNNPAFGGKPVSLLSGMETFAPSTDLSLGNLFPIRITRSYNSRTFYDSPLGYGWAINLDKRLYTYADGSVTVRRECGGKKRFTLSGPGYIGQTGDTGTLIQNPADGTFTYTDKYGETEKYDSKGRLMSMADAKGNSLVFTYTGVTREALWGLLLSNNNQTSPLIVAYDYRLSKIEEKDASGSLTGTSVTLHYNAANGRLTDIQDSTGRMVSYTQDTIGNLTAASGPGISASYAYNDPNNKHLLTTIDDGNGAYVNEYDASGRVKKQTHGTGVIIFEYITPYQKTKMTTTIADSAGTVLNTQYRTVEFDTNGMPVKVTDTFGNATIYVRDVHTWITREEYWENTGTVAAPNLVLKTATNFTYDAKGNTLTRTEAQGTAVEKTTTYTYHPTYSLVTTETVSSVVNLSQSRVITNTYDAANGNLRTMNEAGILGDGTPYNYTTTYDYYTVADGIRNGKLKSIDGPRTDVQDVTTFGYDLITGYRTSMTQPIIGSTTYSNFDSLGNPQTVTDPNNNSTTYTYDSTGRVTSVKAQGDTNATQYFYVSGGCTSCGGANKIDHITLPEGNTIWYTYDTMGNLITIKDSLNNTINYTYDSESNRLTEQIKDSAGSLQKTLSYQYDALNRLAKTVNPDNAFSQYTYDALGNRKTAKDPNGGTTTYNYDALSRLVSVIQPGAVTTQYGYSTNNNLTSVIDANNNTTTYKYDDKGRVYQVISPDTGTTTYAYDPAGNLIAKTDAKGITITYTYDALNRLTSITSPAVSGLDAFSVTYGYDTCTNGKGRLCSMTDASGSMTYAYTAKGQVATESKTITGVSGNPYVTQYTYDQNGNIKTMIYPSGKVITYNYTNDRAVSVLNGAANLATNITYKPFGGMNGLTYGNGLAGSISYDEVRKNYRITGITAGSVLSLSYPTYDNNGNIQAINDTLDPTKNKSFTYDALDRLWTAATGTWNFAWTYDGVGNRQTEGSTVYSYAPGTNKLTGAGGLSFGYDNNGNTTSQAARSYTYNQNQRLLQVVDGAMTASYTYNGNGQRVKKDVNGTTTIFHYSLNGQIIAESNSAGTIAAEYVYLNGQLLAKIEGANTYYYHNDHLGTPQKMTKSDGSVVWSADYKPFGETASITSLNGFTNNLRFPGQYYDAETGLLYNYFRDYNPIIGRYIEADPVGIYQGKNHLYAYARNNSISYKDPLGLLVPCSQRDKEFQDCFEGCGKFLDQCYIFADQLQKDCENASNALCKKWMNNPTSFANCKRLAMITCDTISGVVKTLCKAGYAACVLGCAFPPGDCGCERGK